MNLKNRITRLSLFLLLFPLFHAKAQETFPVNGVADKKHIYYAFTNCSLHVDYQTVIPSAVLIVRDGLVEAAGQNISLPQGAVVTDLKGKHIYPGLIDIYTGYGLPDVKKPERKPGPQMESNTPGAYAWNQAIKAEANAVTIFKTNPKAAEELRKLGFGAVLTFQADGIARGTSAFVHLSDEKENQVIIKEKVSTHYSFSKGSSSQDYPSSLMGAIALLKQTLHDAVWYKQERAKLKEKNLSLEALNANSGLPRIFEANDKYNVLRAQKIADEFGLSYIYKGGGNEYQRIDAMKATKASFILPLNFPEVIEVDDPYETNFTLLDEMKHWEMAPANPRFFEQAGITFALSAGELKDKSDFYKNLRKAVEHGLSENAALKSLTHSPADMVGLSDKIGSLKPGMYANFMITSASLFDKKNIIYENWVNGLAYKINDMDAPDIRGNYRLSAGNLAGELIVTGEPGKPEAKFKKQGDTTKVSVELAIQRKLITLSFYPAKEENGKVRLSGNILENKMQGRGQSADGVWLDWSAEYISADTSKAKKDTAEAKKPVIGEVIYPFMAYGWKKKPVAETILFRNATIWTNEKEGILANADLLISGGKIVKTGKNLEAPADARVIDASGKHISSGIIDEHSHIAISKGVNEGTQSVTSEVSIADVVNPDNINVYRQLAGGVTAAQLLHGSANAIGGQSALIKFRWGATPEEMKIKGTPGFIKFALGENVKQANWGDNNTSRFPQTRMGVEQVFYDAFIRAKEYDAQNKKYNALSVRDREKAIAPRKDLELDALVEILQNKRFITCHSYVQSEILMLMHVGDSMGFKVNTFTHILEGYKVRQQMKKHGAAGSTFSDWWAYKFEVNDAIPHNAALMHEAGILTSINSDDAEMGRRLNQEAAKTVKYGNVPEEEALKFVTLNPAKILKLDNITGSIRAGKDADIVLWTDNPLSVYAKAEQTYVDGVCYFDLAKDIKLREEIAAERSRLVQKMIIARKNGEKTKKPEAKEERLYHCDTIEE